MKNYKKLIKKNTINPGKPNPGTSPEDAYSLFNKIFFDNELPPLMMNDTQTGVAADGSPEYEIELIPDYRYTCPCGEEFWAYPGMNISCGKCGGTFVADAKKQ